MSEAANATEGAAELVVRPKGEQRLDAKLADGNKVLAPADWQMLSAIAETVNGTEFVPVGLRGNAPKVLACMLYGHALGVSPMIALKEIAVIDGTPSMSSALMVAKVIEAGHKISREEIRDEHGAISGTTAHGIRGDNGQEDSYTFTVDMARRAGLMSKKNWTSYPEAMLWWRSSSQLCSFLFPDVFMGSPYMPEELGVDSPPALEALRDEAAVSPSPATEPEATPEQDEPLAAAEPPAGPAVAVETPEDAAVRLARAFDGAPADEIEVEPVDEDEGVWTPLDDRDPTLAEYERAVSFIADPGVWADQEALAENLAAAQWLVEAYQETHPPAAEPQPITPPPAEPETVVVKGTAAELLVQIGEAQARGDREWLQALKEQEQSASRPRSKVIAGIEEAFAAIDKPVTEADTVTAPFTPGTEDTAQEQLAVNETGHRFDPNIPLEDLDHTQLVVRARAIIGYMTTEHPEVKDWRYEAIIISASNIWKLPVHTLDDLENQNLRAIIEAAPAEALETLSHMAPEYIEKIAGTVLGDNPA